MKRILPALSTIALLILLAGPVLYLAGEIAKPAMKTIMLTATLLWFVTAPLWMGRDSRSSQE